ncbi:MAG: hypothetical protein DSY87_03430 [Methylococcus sp.]|nr:MAG: hypothetical protein DSY87_03430 [Methylococcus sp.]
MVELRVKLQPPVQESFMSRIFLLSEIIFLTMLAGTARAQTQWIPSELSDPTIEKIKQQSIVYHQCLEGKIAGFNLVGTDSRDAANIILKKCEAELREIRTLLTNANVPAPGADRYLLRKRHQAARKVLQYMMYAKSRELSN